MQAWLEEPAGVWVVTGSSVDLAADQLRLTCRDAPDRVVAAVPPSPDPRRALALSILRNLDKDIAQDMPTRTEDVWTLAATWLLAHRPSLVAIVGTEHLDEGTLASLTALQAQAGLRLLLLDFGADPTTPRDVLAKTHGWPTIDAFALVDVRRALKPRRTDEQPAVRETTTGRRLPALPGSDVPHFLGHCREGLTPAAFERVYRLFVDAATRTADAVADGADPSDRTWLGGHLKILVGSEATLSHELTVLRGAQAGLWQQDWHLRVPYRSLRAVHLDGAQPHGNEDASDEDRMHNACDRLARCLDPQDALLGLCSLATGMSPADLALLNADQVAGERLLNLGLRRVRLRNPVIVRAALALRDHRGGGVDGALFVSKAGERISPTHIRRVLLRLALETGLNLANRWTASSGRTPATWLNVRRIKATRL